MVITKASGGAIVTFEVTDGGTLSMADYPEAESRSDFYEDVANRWEASPQDLSDAMEECPPLAWAVSSIYSDFRYEIMADIRSAKTDFERNRQRIAALEERLRKLPEESESGASASARPALGRPRRQSRLPRPGARCRAAGAASPPAGPSRGGAGRRT